MVLPHSIDTKNTAAVVIASISFFISVPLCRFFGVQFLVVYQRSGTNARPSEAGVFIIVSRLLREIRTRTMTVAR